MDRKGRIILEEHPEIYKKARMCKMMKIQRWECFRKEEQVNIVNATKWEQCSRDNE